MSNPPAIRPALLSVTNAARYLGLSMPTVWRHLNNGLIPRTRIGGRTMIKRTELDAFIERHTEGVA